MNLCSTTHMLFTRMGQVISKQDFFFVLDLEILEYWLNIFIHKDSFKTMPKTYGRLIWHEYATSWAASEQTLKVYLL